MVRVFIPDNTSTTGGGLTGLTSASTNLQIAYMRECDGTAVVYTGANIEAQTTVGTYQAPSSSAKCRFKVVDATNFPGLYEIQFHNDATIFGTADTSQFVIVNILEITTAVLKIGPNMTMIPLVPYDPQDAVRMGLTALPNAAAEAAGGLFTRGTGAGQINQAANGEISVNVIKLNSTAQTARDIGLSVLVGDKTGFSLATAPPTAAEIGTQIWTTSTPRAITDKAGFSLATAPPTAAENADAVWDEVLSGHTGTGSAGLALASASAPSAATVADAVWDEARADHVGAGTFGQGAASVQGNVTGSAASVTGAVGSVTGAVGSVTGNVGGSVASVTGAVGSVTGNVGGSVASVTGAVGSVTGNIGGSVASVTGAVGSVTGNVGGNVVGSVDSVTNAVGSVTAAVTVDTIADNTITSDTIATDAITSAQLHVTALSEIADATWDELLADHMDSGTAGLALASASAPSAADVADAVWEEVLADHLDVGSTGEALNAAGTAGDPWITPLPGAYGTGTAGKIIGDNINATIASRLAPTVAARTLDVTATGAAGIDLANVENQDTVINLSATTVAEVVTVTANVTGDVLGNVAGDLAGKVLGGGSSAMTGTGVRAVDSSGADIAPAATALSNTTWTAPKAAFLDDEISSRLAPTVPGRMLDVTTDGCAGIDWGNVENSDASNLFSQTSINASLWVTECGTVQNVTGTVAQVDALGAQAKLDVNAEVDLALNTTVPEGVGYESINCMVEQIYGKLPTGSIGDATLAGLDDLSDEIATRAPGDTAISNATLTNERIAALDHLDDDMTSRAAAATALSTATWTPERAALIDNLDAAVTTRAPAATAITNATLTDTRIEKLDNLDAAVTTRIAPTVAGRTLDVTATGAAGVDWGNVENPSTAVDLSATDIQLCDSVTEVGTVTGDVDGSVAEVEALGAQAKLDVNAEIDSALNTAIPGSPTADSINERIASIDSKLPAGGIGDATAANQTTLLTRVPGVIEPQTGDSFARLGSPVGANVSADIAGIKSESGTLVTRIPGTVQPQTGDSFARLGVPAGASVSADIEAVKLDSAAILYDTETTGVQIAASERTEIADAVLQRDLDQVEVAAAVHSLTTAGLKLVSKVAAVGAELKTYRTDGTTIKMIQALTTDDTVDPIKEIGVGA
jgi:hypothetical protein